MIVKIFANRGGGSPSASIDYLLGKDRKREGAEVLKGDPELSKTIAESLEFKNAYTVGCLSFEEKTISDTAKKEVMEKFEKMIFAGLKEDQYNITWIEHSDKDRVELNFFIPNVELTTQKRLQPYYDKVDRPMVDCFKKVINHEYGFTSPDLLEKKQLSKINLNTAKNTKELKNTVATFVYENISNGKITNRDQIVSLLKDSGYEVSRKTDKSISIKNPYDENGRNIRFSGEIYEKEFYETINNTRELGQSVAEARSREEARDRQAHAESYERSKREFHSRVEHRTEQFSKSYQEKNTLESSTTINHSDIIDDLARHGLLVLDKQKRSRELSSRDKSIQNEFRSLTERNTDIEAVGERVATDKRIFAPHEPLLAGRRGFDLHSEQNRSTQVESERQLRVQNDHRSTKATAEINPTGIQAFYELLERSRNHYHRIRERITDVFSQVRGIENKLRESITGTREVKESSIDSEPNLTQIERLVERYNSNRKQSIRSEQQINGVEQLTLETDRTIKSTDQHQFSCIDQAERSYNQLGATVEAVNEKIAHNSERNKGWSMSR